MSGVRTEQTVSVLLHSLTNTEEGWSFIVLISEGTVLTLLSLPVNQTNLLFIP